MDMYYGMSPCVVVIPIKLAVLVLWNVTMCCGFLIKSAVLCTFECNRMLQLSHQVGSLMDIYPTIVELAGLSLPKDVFFDGQSLVETLLDGNETER